MSKPARLSATETAEDPLDEQELARIDAWWHARNYLSFGMIYEPGQLFAAAVRCALPARPVSKPA